MPIKEQMIVLPARGAVPSAEIYVKTHVKEELGKRDVMMLIPGGPGGNHTVYNGIKDQLFCYADLVMVDLRGCGKSKPAEVRHCDIYEHIEDIEALRIALGLRRMILLGGSYGSMVALGYAVAYSDRLKKLLLLAGASSSDFLETAKSNIVRIGTAEQIAWAEKLWTGSFASVEELNQFYAHMGPLYSIYLRDHPDYAPPTTAERVPYNFELANFAYQNHFYHFDFRDSLDKVTVATVIIGGENDWINDPKHLNEIHKGIAGSKLFLLRSCGHYMWLDQPEAFFEGINFFFNEDAASRNAFITKTDKSMSGDGTLEAEM